MTWKKRAKRIAATIALLANLGGIGTSSLAVADAAGGGSQPAAHSVAPSSTTANRCTHYEDTLNNLLDTPHKYREFVIELEHEIRRKAVLLQPPRPITRGRWAVHNAGRVRARGVNGPSAMFRLVAPRRVVEVRVILGVFVGGDVDACSSVRQPAGCLVPATL